MKLHWSTAAVLLALASPLALAQQPAWYAGVGIGKAYADIDVNSVVTRLHGGGYNSSTLSTYDNDTAAKVFGGYRFNRYFSLEGGYFDLGDFSFTANVVPAGTQQGTASINGLSLDLVGTLPLQDNLSAFARLGVNHAKIGQAYSNTLMAPGFANRTDRGTHENYGAGLQWVASEAFAVRAELQRYRISTNGITTNNMSTLSLSLMYLFGAGKAPQEVVRTVTAVPAPAPVASAPAPARAAPVKITLAASALFDFDKAELKTAGKQELDKLAQGVKDVRYEVIIVTGHSDRLGAPGYNLALSQRRANAVKSYLVSAGIPAGNISAKGVGIEMPVTTLQQCQGPVSDALKACLQPDRRVEVEVSGTRQ